MTTEREARGAGWRLIRGALRPQWRWVAFGIGSGLAWTVTKVSVPWLVSRAIDRGLTPGDTDELRLWALLIVAVGLVQALATAGRRYSAFRLALRTETNLRARLFAHLQRLHFAYHDQAQTGQLMARAATDIQQVHIFVVLFPLTVASLLTLAAVVVVLVASNPVLALFALATLPFVNLAARRFTLRIQPVTLSLQEELADLSGVVEETVSGIRAVKGYATEDLQAGRLDHEADSVLDRALAAARLRAGFIPLMELLPTLALVAILFVGGHQVLDGRLTIGELVAFNSYVFMTIWPLRLLGMLMAQAPRSAAAAGRVAEVLTTAPAVADPARAKALPPGPGELRFEGVRFSYGEGRPVLDGLDLVIEGGEAVALVGPTGCGKSTLARLLPRFYDPDFGTVRLDGVDVRELRLQELRRAIGIVFEDTFLFSDTVRDNIAFADPDAPLERVRHAAALAGADEFVEALAEGYETVIGEHGYSLSGGQRQRIAIARAVLSEPRVLILDDATSSVDPTKEHEIRAALREVMAGRTTLIIAHRPATIALADRVVLLGEGRVLAEGTHEELLATSAAYRDVLAHAEAEEVVRAAAGALGDGDPPAGGPDRGDGSGSGGPAGREGTGR
ncbi:MAG: ABC transporter ATP-binding protein/permease [Acidimicrobiia bacterium]|nr:ABC transporter ATP-binding protein/permease [Acidimicrobiia bacterium]